MRILIHGSERPLHIQQFIPLMKLLDSNPNSEYIFFQSKSDLPIQPTNKLFHRIRDFCWDRFNYARNSFNPKDWRWIWKQKGQGPNKLESPAEQWEFPCPPTKSNIPWKPDLVIGTTPHEGHMRYQLIPWASKNNIPILSIDHGAPMVPYSFGNYRGSMMGCTANAVWGEVSKTINTGYGAPSTGQIITGSPTLDELSSMDVSKKTSRKQILLMTTHREPLKSAMDSMMERVIEQYISNTEFEIVVKPHPVELIRGTLQKLPQEIRIITEQGDLHACMQAAHCIVSPATSVIIPALAMGIPFVNILQPGSGLTDEKELQILNQHIGLATFTPEQLEDVVEGRLTPDPNECKIAFERLGYKADGQNAARVLHLAKHIVLGNEPDTWTDPFN
ncbi:MAG: hypothetical protein QF440_05825 [Candidatus Thalassarchaeaceae archaeon]|nr:hypothetical protein [Candidatus Thalassarchaeaceae archaeon]